MLSHFSLISHSTAAIAYGLLSLLIATRYLRRDIDRTLLLASLVTVLWAGSLVSQGLWGEPSFFIRYLLELLRDAAWITVLFALLRDSFRSANLVGRLRRVLAAATLILVTLLLGSGALEYFFGLNILDGKTKVVGQLSLIHI